MLKYIESIDDRDPEKWLFVTHECCDFDAATAILLLQEHGQQKWPTITDAEVTFLGNGGNSVFGLNEDQLLTAKMICVDLGGGMYDHHSHGHDEKVGECATSLVVKDLGIQGQPNVSTLAEYCQQVDSKGCGENELPYFIDRLFRQASGNPYLTQDAFVTSFELINSFLAVGLMPTFDWQKSLNNFFGEHEKAKQFLANMTPVEASPFSISFCLGRMIHHAVVRPERIYSTFVELEHSFEMELAEMTGAAEDALAQATVRAISVPNNLLEVALVNSDCRLVGKLAKSRGHNFAVLIQQFSSGHIIVFINRRTANLFHNCKVSDIVKAIRWHEITAMLNFSESSEATAFVPALTLGSPGRIEQAPHWWFDPNTLTLINGGNKHPDVEPTNLTGASVFKIVYETLNGGYFPPDFSESCTQGVCAHHAPERVCPFFGCQLHRCIRIREHDPKWRRPASKTTITGFAPREKPLS